MNIDTGEIRQFAEEISKQNDKFFKDQFGRWIEIEENDMTPKQKIHMAVSLKDTRSKLGKMRHELIKTENGNSRKKTRRSRKHY